MFLPAVEVGDMRILQLEHDRQKIRLTRRLGRNVFSLECHPCPVLALHLSFYDTMMLIMQEVENDRAYSMDRPVGATPGR